MPREYSRNQRIGTEVLRTLSELLRFEIKDPRLKNVSLTGVDLSRDLGVARVYFSMLDPGDSVEPVQEGLMRAAGFLRSKLGQSLQIRHVPELRLFLKHIAFDVGALASNFDIHGARATLRTRQS